MDTTGKDHGIDSRLAVMACYLQLHRYGWMRTCSRSGLLKISSPVLTVPLYSAHQLLSATVAQKQIKSAGVG